MPEGTAEKQGDQNFREEEFLHLFAKSQRGLHAYILALVFDADAAADLLQETNIVLWQKFEQYQAGTNFFAWAREVARLTVLRYRRTNSKRIATLDPHLLEELAERFSESQDSGDHEREALAGCLKKLRDGDREMIVTRYRPGASVGTMAKRLGRPENSVSQSLCRIRRTLAECIQRVLQADKRGFSG